MGRDGKNALSQTAIYLLARGLPGIVAFLMIPVFSRLLDPAEYGRYALVLATAGLLNSLLLQWMRLSLVRFLPAYSADVTRLKATLIGSTLVVVAVLGVISGLVASLPIGPVWRGAILASWGLTAAQGAFDLCCEYARGTIQPWRYMWMQVIRSGVAIVLGVALVRIGWGWWGPFAGLGAGLLAASAMAYPRDWAGIRPRIDREVLRRLAHYGIPVAMTVALTAVIFSSDRFLIAGMLGEGAAGLWSVAVDFTSQTLMLVMVVVSMAIFPLAVHAWEKEGPAAAREQMRHNASLLLAVGAPCVTGLAVLTPGIAHSFLGEEFREAALRVMPLMGLGTFIAGMKAFHFDAAFQFVHRTILQVWIVLAAAVLNVGLNLLAIPAWGLNGAIVASIAAYVLAIVATVWIGRRYLVMPFPFGDAARVALACIVMAVALYPFRWTLGAAALGVQIALGAGIYGTMLMGLDFMELRQGVIRRGMRMFRRSKLEPSAPLMAASSLMEIP